MKHGEAYVDQVWMEITVLTGSDLGGIQQTLDVEVAIHLFLGQIRT